MPREIIFDPEARLEFERAVEWYDEKQPGLGDRFEAEVYATFHRILQNPERFRLVGKTVRVARLRAFIRYAVYFHVEPDFIGIVSVFHGSRDPAELRRRLK
jgi:plasmid stabilization system protein ParE